MQNDWILPVIDAWEKKEAYGQIVLNFAKGTIAIIDKRESEIKPKNADNKSKTELKVISNDKELE